MDGQARPGVQLLVTDVAFEMLGLLVLDEDLLIIKVSVAVPAPGLELLLLLPPHVRDISLRATKRTARRPVTE